MAVLRTGILGGISGKVANIVGGRWKTTDYIRSLVIPANPKTDAQLAQRYAMSINVSYARQVLGSVINAFWDPFETAMSGFNRFIQVNLLVWVVPINYLLHVYAKGKLTTVPITDAIYTTGTGALVVQYSSVLQGNMKADDKAVLVVKDKTQNRTYFLSDDAIRSDGSTTITLPTGLDTSGIYAYLFFAQYKEDILDMVSDSAAELVVEP